MSLSNINRSLTIRTALLYSFAALKSKYNSLKPSMNRFVQWFWIEAVPAVKETKQSIDDNPQRRRSRLEKSQFQFTESRAPGEQGSDETFQVLRAV